MGGCSLEMQDSPKGKVHKKGKGKAKMDRQGKHCEDFRGGEEGRHSEREEGCLTIPEREQKRGGGNVVHSASPVDWMGSQIKPHAAHTLLRLPHFFGAGLLLYDSLCRNISEGLWAPGASFGALNG